VAATSASSPRWRSTSCRPRASCGGRLEAEAYLKPLRSIAVPAIDTLGPTPLAAVGEIAAEPDDPLPLIHDSTLLTGCDGPAVAALTEAVDLGHSTGLPVTEIRQLGGALARPSETQGAAGHMEEPFLLIYGGVVAVPELAGRITDLVNRVSTAMRPYSAGRTVPNFASDAERAYPANVLARLGALKHERDPRGVIRSNKPVIVGS
jgi:hypothetical protein